MPPCGLSHSAPFGAADASVRQQYLSRHHSTHLITSFGHPRTRFYSILLLITYHLSRVSFRILRDGTHSAHFRIPWTKTTKEEGATVILTGRNDVLCPCRALRNHLDVNADIPSSAALFAYRLPSGAHRNMIKHVFINFVTSIWKSASLAHVSGHSFRIGGAVELLLAGVPPEVVAATGGWNSLSFLLYWRRMEEILPMSTSKAYKKIHIDELAGIFERFRIEHNISRSLLDKAGHEYTRESRGSLLASIEVLKSHTWIRTSSFPRMTRIREYLLTSIGKYASTCCLTSRDEYLQVSLQVLAKSHVLNKLYRLIEL
jgi:hypothetical protein